MVAVDKKDYYCDKDGMGNVVSTSEEVSSVYCTVCCNDGWL
jgi:hypothetical protein